MKRALAFTFFALLAAVCLLAAGRSWAGQVLGDAVSGGRIYDNWVVAMDFVAPQTTHPLWTTQDNNRNSGSVTWLCSECHGWDYKGAAGAFGPYSSQYTGFKGVMGMVGATQQEVYTWLNGSANPNHDFSAYLDASAMQDLAAFLRTRQIDASLMIDPYNGGALGDSDRGEYDYRTTCSQCHGPQGDLMNFGTQASPLYLADLAVANPWRFVHKVRFGSPLNASMPATEDLGWSLSRVANVLAYTQTLERGNPTLRPFNASAAGPVQLESQANITPLVWAAGIIFLIVAAGVGYDFYQQRLAKR